MILRQLKDRITLTSLPNGWITQTGGGIETLAAVPLTINEMLLQSYEGILRVFPCYMENPWSGEKVQLIRNGRMAGILSGARFHFFTSPGERIRLAAFPVNGLKAEYRGVDFQLFVKLIK